MKLNDILSHPVGLLPWTLALVDGSPRGSNISSLAKEHEKNMIAAGMISRARELLITIVQRIRGDQKTFAKWLAASFNGFA